MKETEVKERPILFSGPMLRAILKGRKTQTRRVVKLRGGRSTSGAFWDHAGYEPVEVQPGEWAFRSIYGNGDVAAGSPRWRCPYGAVGDRLWVRETWRVADGGTKYYEYAADRSVLREAVDEACCVKWKPSIYMKRAASRITLEVVAVRVERLQEITPEDAIAEGIGHSDVDAAVVTYSSLWDRINGRGSWDANPWVWVVEFRKVEGGAA